jgi:hypothetical protein
LKKLTFTFFFILKTFLFSQNPEWINFTSGKEVQSFEREGNFIWVGTTSGLVKINMINGETEIFNKLNTDLPDNDFQAIVIDNLGNK